MATTINATTHPPNSHRTSSQWDDPALFSFLSSPLMGGYTNSRRISVSSDVDTTNTNTLIGNHRPSYISSSSGGSRDDVRYPSGGIVKTTKHIRTTEGVISESDDGNPRSRRNGTSHRRRRRRSTRRSRKKPTSSTSGKRNDATRSGSSRRKDQDVVMQDTMSHMMKRNEDGNNDHQEDNCDVETTTIPLNTMNEMVMENTSSSCKKHKSKKNFGSAMFEKMRSKSKKSRGTTTWLVDSDGGGGGREDNGHSIVTKRNQKHQVQDSSSTCGSSSSSIHNSNSKPPELPLLRGGGTAESSYETSHPMESIVEEDGAGPTFLRKPIGKIRTCSIQ